MDEIKPSFHEKCLNDFHSLVAMHQKHSFAALTGSSQLVNIKVVRAHFSWSNLYLRERLRLSLL